MSANGHKRVSTNDLISIIEKATGKPARKVGKEHLLRCPHHGDVNPSLNVREGDGGYPLIRCRSQGCTPEQILDAVGLTWVDVFGDDSEHWTPSGEPWIACYDYTDADGALLYQVVRTADKQFSQRRPDPDKPHGWAWNLRGVERVPFHLPQLLSAIAAGERVWVVEGERDVLALEKHGEVATCNSGGAGKWPAPFAQHFAGAQVRIVPDQDAPGRAHALTVYRSLERTTAELTILAPRVGKDAADHLSAGFSADDFQPLTVSDLAPPDDSDSAAPVEAVSVPADGVPRLRFLGGRAFIEQPLAGVEPLMGTGEDGLLLPGSLMMLAGIGGSGKTTMSLHMLAHWASGLPWFGIAVARPIRCVVIENEGPHDPFVNKVKEFAERFHGCTCSGEAHGDGDAFLDACLFMDAPWGHFSFDDPGLGRELHDVVVGFGVCTVTVLRDGTRLGEITELFVTPEARSVSVGEGLLAALVEWAREQGCTAVDAFALPGHRAAKNFFETAGFTARALLMHHEFED